MAKRENRDLIGLGYPVTADPMTCDGEQWIAGEFRRRQALARTRWRKRIRSDPPGAPNRDYCGTTEFDSPTIGASRNPRPGRA